MSFVRACFQFLTTLTFRALHGNHIVSTPFQTIVEEDKNKTFQTIVTHVSFHTLTYHGTHYPPPPPPRKPRPIQELIPRRTTKGKTNYYYGRRKDNSQTFCRPPGYLCRTLECPVLLWHLGGTCGLSVVSKTALTMSGTLGHHPRRGFVGLPCLATEPTKTHRSPEVWK